MNAADTAAPVLLGAMILLLVLSLLGDLLTSLMRRRRDQWRQLARKHRRRH